jgi:uncharacterized protein (TIRG00374 family)
MKHIKREYLTYFIGSLVFITLATLTLWLIFKGFKGAGTLIIPGVFSWKLVIQLLVLLSLFYTFDGLRLLFVFKTIGTKVSFFLMLKLIFINIFASGVTPLATGGGFAQVYFLSRNNVSVGTATAATAIRTVIASVLIFASVPLILTMEKGLNAIVPIKHGILFSLLLIMLYIILFYVLVKKKNILKRIIIGILILLNKLHLLKKEKFEKMKTSVDKEIELFMENLLLFWKGSKVFFILSILSSSIYLFLLFFFPYLLLKFMNIDVHILTVLSIQVLITFLIYFTPTPGGSGVAEGGFALIFSNFVSSNFVPPLTFYWRFLTMYLGMIIGFVLFYKEVWKKDNAIQN